jgi:hypothetical protein
MTTVAAWEGFGNVAQGGNSFSDPTDSAHQDGRETRGVWTWSARQPARRQRTLTCRCNSTVDSRCDDRDVVAQAARSACKRKLLELLDDRSRPSPSLVGKQAT